MTNKDDMQQRLLLSMLFIICSIANVKVVASPVTRQQARKNVQSFLEKKGKIASSLVMCDVTSGTSDNESFYIFNVGDNDGYVIASGDDCAPSILGYSDEGALIVESIPDNMTEWLQGYVGQIAYMKEHNLSYRSDTKSDHASILPLLTTTWGQDNPYNQQCPDFFSFGKCVTGCVATAMAQVLYYHRTNSTNKILAEIPGYSCRTNWSGYGQIAVNAIPAGSVIDWENVIEKYKGVSSTEVQQTAVAQLMAYCGASVEMNYKNGSNGGSGASSDNVAGALKKYFGYSKDTYLEKRDNYTSDEWDELVYDELSKGHPVYYSGSNSSGGGHAFVCDGYDGDGYYHINWGWEGLSDGNFLLSVLDPDVQGTGGSNAGYNFNQDALIGAVPRDLSVTEPEAYAVFDNGVLTFYCDDDRNNKTGATYDLNPDNKYPGWNFDYNAENQSYNYAKAANITKVVFDQSFSLATPLSTQYWFAYCQNLEKIEGMGYLNTEYVENMANMFASCYKLSSIDVSTFNTSRVTDFQNMFVNCIGLKSLDISHFVTKKAWTLFHMFRNCINLTEIKLPNDLKQISDSQFKDCGKLTSVTIPGTVREICQNAFNGSGLKTVINFMETPCDIDETVFSGISNSAILYVPIGSYSAYHTAENWKSFYKIMEMDANMDIEVSLNDVYMNAGDQAVMSVALFDELILARLNGGKGMSKGDFEENYRFLDEGEHEDMPNNTTGSLYETAAANSYWGQRFFYNDRNEIVRAADCNKESVAVNTFDYTKWTADNNWFGRVWYSPDDAERVLIWDLHGYTETIGSSTSTYAGNMKDAPNIPTLIYQLMNASGASYESAGTNTNAISTVVRFVNRITGTVINVKLVIPIGKMHFAYGMISDKDLTRWFAFNSAETGVVDNTKPYWGEFDVHANPLKPSNNSYNCLDVTSYSQLLTDYWENPLEMSVLSGEKSKFTKFYDDTSGASPTYEFLFTTPQKDVNSLSVSATDGQWVVLGASGVRWTLQLAAHNGIEGTGIVAVEKDGQPYGPEEICYLDGQFKSNEAVVARNNRIHFHGLENNASLYPAATDLLNKVGSYDEQGNARFQFNPETGSMSNAEFLDDNVNKTFTAYLRLHVLHDCYDPLIGKNLFNVRFHRPINVAAKVVRLEEETMGEMRIPVKDLVEIVDWNRMPVVAAGDLPFEYYGISELAVRYDEIRTDHAKSAAIRLNTYSSIADIVANTDLVKDVSSLTTADDSGLRPVSVLNADGSTVSYADAHAYNHSDLNATGNGTNFGWLYFNDNSSETQAYHIYVPISVKYNWGNIAYDYLLDDIGVKLDKDYTQTAWAVITVNASQMPDYMMGDANGDKTVNVMDVVSVIDYILLNPVENFVMAAADINSDNIIDVLDVVGVVDIILNSTAGTRRMGARRDEGNTGNDQLLLTRLEDGSFKLDLFNDGRYIAAQFDIRLSKGQGLENIRLNSERFGNSNSLFYSEVEKGVYRVVVCSLGNDKIRGYAGELLNFFISGSNDSFTVENILFATENHKRRHFESISSQTAGIENLNRVSEPADVYSLDGRLMRKSATSLRGLPKGIYIVNKEKIIIR